jgi:hypothetical protein
LQGYEKTDISSEDDLKIREDLDLADAEMEEVSSYCSRSTTSNLNPKVNSVKMLH